MVEIDPELQAILNSRRPRGWLSTDINRVCVMYVTGEIQLPESKFLTPHRAGMLLKEVDSLDIAPSSGAVEACFRRWQKYGYAVFIEQPFAFIDFTEEGRLKGLDALIEERKTQRKKERKSKNQVKETNR